jgi:hypothetical protein
MRRVSPPAWARRFAFALFALALASACSETSSTLAGADLQARARARLEAERPALLESIGHYALVYDVDQAEFHRFMAQIHPRRDSADIAMAGAGGLELHGGGALRLLATLWRPDDRAAELSDSFPFAETRRGMQLRKIYESLRQQIFLPVPGVAREDIEAFLPPSPQLPRTRVRHAAGGKREISELDAYNALALLLRYQDDLRAQWTNRLGQRLNTQLLLDNTWDHYGIPRSAEEEFDDHSYLHLVELLLDYHRRLGTASPFDPTVLKERLLSVELERSTYGGYEASEALGHYAESLGLLLAEPGITWTPSDERKVRAWLQELEEVRLAEIGEVPPQHLAHLVRGLALIEANADRLEASGETP